VLEEVLQGFVDRKEPIPQFLKQQLQHQQQCLRNAERLARHGMSSQIPASQSRSIAKPPSSSSSSRESRDNKGQSGGQDFPASGSRASPGAAAADAGARRMRATSRDDVFSEDMPMVVGSAPLSHNHLLGSRSRR